MATVDIPEPWTPTPDNINSLPDPLRRYIHELQTNADPVGALGENFRLRQENDMLRFECEWLKALKS